jgi:hypothetical protein
MYHQKAIIWPPLGAMPPPNPFKKGTKRQQKGPKRAEVWHENAIFTIDANRVFKIG